MRRVCLRPDVTPLGGTSYRHPISHSEIRICCPHEPRAVRVWLLSHVSQAYLVVVLTSIPLILVQQVDCPVKGGIRGVVTPHLAICTTLILVHIEHSSCILALCPPILPEILILPLQTRVCLLTGLGEILICSIVVFR
jgi:hypothetical protein